MSVSEERTRKIKVIHSKAREAPQGNSDLRRRGKAKELAGISSKSGDQKSG
jgi:hypothetical protein